MVIKIPLESLDIPTFKFFRWQGRSKAGNCEDQLENLVDCEFGRYYIDQYLLAVGWKI